MAKGASRGQVRFTHVLASWFGFKGDSVALSSLIPNQMGQQMSESREALCDMAASMGVHPMQLPEQLVRPPRREPQPWGQQGRRNDRPGPGEPQWIAYPRHSGPAGWAFIIGDLTDTEVRQAFASAV